MTLRWRECRTLLWLRWSRRGPLLLPGAELLLLVPLLLCVSLLHGSHRLGQRMRPPLRRRSPILGLSLIAILWLRSPLRLPNPRRRLRLVASATGLSKRTEAIFRLRLPRHWSNRYQPTRRFVPHQ